MRIVYRIITAVIYFILWPYGRIRAAAGSELWRGRLGLIAENGKYDVWIHAASVGETKISGYLIDYLVHKKAQLRIYLTTMTVSGNRIAKKFKTDNVAIGYFPLDSRGPVRKTLAKINPKALVITETEIWPNLIESAFLMETPIILVNGRLSDKAFRKYRALSHMFGRLLSRYDRIFVKTVSDEEKFKSFKLSGERVSMAGDMKFDAPLIWGDEMRKSKIRRLMVADANDFVLAAGSTRPDEERQLLQLLNSLKNEGIKLLLVLAPRHLERLAEVKSEIESLNLSYMTYGSDHGTAPVVLVDKMGVLNDIYQASDLAFVGGTLVDVGGHNILEPVWAGTPVVFGPYIGNITESKDYVLQNNYGAMVESINEMAELVKKFINDRSMFSVKTEDDLSHSPTATVGDYILKKLSDV